MRLPAFCAKSGAFARHHYRKTSRGEGHDKESISDHGCTERIHHRSAGKQGVRGGGKVYRCGSRKRGILQGDFYKGYPYGGLSVHPGRKASARSARTGRHRRI